MSVLNRAAFAGGVLENGGGRLGPAKTASVSL
jgi:hypothetical protein